MLYSDRQSLYLATFTVLCFIFFSIMDVAGIFPAMENMAVRLIIVGLFLLVVINVILSMRKKNHKKNLPISEEFSSEYKQM